MKRKPPKKARFRPGDLVQFKGDHYLVTGNKAKPALKVKPLTMKIKEGLNVGF